MSVLGIFVSKNRITVSPCLSLFTSVHGGMISSVAYQARTPDFWQACDGTAGPAYWCQFGTTGDAKGEPTHINSISHGCSPTRFRAIDVILTD